MKKLVYIISIFSTIILFNSFYSNASVLSELVHSHGIGSFKPVELFRYLPSNPSAVSLEGYIQNGTYLKLDKKAVTQILDQHPENILFKVPLSNNSSIEFELVRSQVLSDNFKTASLSGEGTVNEINYSPGIYYRGIIKGDNSSWAALSVFDDFVMMVASGKEGNLNLSSIRSGNTMYSDNYIFFNDIDLKIKNNFECATNDFTMWKNHIPGSDMTSSQQNDPRSFPVQGPIRKYFECDYKMYQDFGSNTTNVNNFVTSIYNANIAFYQNDQITTQLQSVYIWITADPYIPYNDLYIMLKKLGGRIKNTFNGNLAHLISTRTNTGGGIAWIDVLCYPYNSGDSSGPNAVSIIDTVNRPFPVYTWITNVLCHEMGHNIGSPHTHSCSWQGGPIDTCYTIEGSCYSGPPKPRVGTIMSYCHSNGSINLSLGFGPLPGNLVRQRYNSASCLIGIQQIGITVPQNFILSQNYPNPFNPSTKIFFDLPAGNTGNRTMFTELTVYDAVGRKIAELAGIDLAPGRYSVDFDASALPSGIYFYRLNTGNFTQTNKMVLVK